jgi:predicted metal-binding membrane protein
VLILPPGHAQTVAAHRRLSRREQGLVGGVLGVLVVLAVAVAVSLATAGHHTGHGCIDVNISSSLGNQEFYRCGARARAMCAAAGTPGGYVGLAARDIAQECRKLSLPVGGSG